MEAVSAGQGAPSRLASQKVIQTSAYIATASGIETMNVSISKALHLATKVCDVILMIVVPAPALKQPPKTKSTSSIEGPSFTASEHR